MPAADGAAARFLAFLDEHGREKPAQFLKRAWDYLDAEGLAGDELVPEWAKRRHRRSTPCRPSALHPRDRPTALLVKALDDGHAPATRYDLFATEGGTAAMCYLFYSLKCNFLVNPGDRIARPYLHAVFEHPHTERYDLDVTYIQANTIDADGLHTWQYPDSELEKLRDPSIKLLCLVNPSNPPSVALDDASRAKLVSLVKNERPTSSSSATTSTAPSSPTIGRCWTICPTTLPACTRSRSTSAPPASASRRHRHSAEKRVRRPHRESCRGTKRALANRYACLTDHIEEGGVHRPHGIRLAPGG